MRMNLKIALLIQGVRQYRMAAALGLDPTKVSRIITGVVEPSGEDKRAIAAYLNRAEQDLFEPQSAHQQLGAN